MPSKKSEGMRRLEEMLESLKGDRGMTLEEVEEHALFCEAYPPDRIERTAAHDAAEAEYERRYGRIGDE